MGRDSDEQTVMLKEEFAHQSLPATAFQGHCFKSNYYYKKGTNTTKSERYKYVCQKKNNSLMQTTVLCRL